MDYQQEVNSLTGAMGPKQGAYPNYANAGNLDNSSFVDPYYHPLEYRSYVSHDGNIGYVPAYMFGRKKQSRHRTKKSKAHNKGSRKRRRSASRKRRSASRKRRSANISRRNARKSVCYDIQFNPSSVKNSKRLLLRLKSKEDRDKLKSHIKKQFKRKSIYSYALKCNSDTKSVKHWKKMLKKYKSKDHKFGCNSCGLGFGCGCNKDDNAFGFGSCAGMCTM